MPIQKLKGRQRDGNVYSRKIIKASGIPDWKLLARRSWRQAY